MMRRSMAAADVFPALAGPDSDTISSESDSSNTALAYVIPALADPVPDPDTISDSGPSSSPPSPQPQVYSSAMQVFHARSYGAQAISILEEGYPIGIEEMVNQVFQGTASAAAVKAIINSYLNTWGQIPMIRLESPLDLNALPPPDASQPHRPVICAYCNYAFCFGIHEIPLLVPAPGQVYPAPPMPITVNLLTPAPVGPLNGDGDLWAPPAQLLVCSSMHHFIVTMGRLQLPGGAAALAWKSSPRHGVLPTPVANGGGSSSWDLRAGPPAPPPEPWMYAGAHWNYVVPGDEDMVELSLHSDPLNLTLGR